MANDTAATGHARALELLEKHRADAHARVEELHARRARVAEVLFGGGSLRALGRELRVVTQTIRNDVDWFKAQGLTVPVRRASRKNTQQERLPVA